ncbi:ATP-binding protein [Streptomyces sp. HUAS 31]|uniref:ATP-binding protein n=1 Tax=Streptomyces sp. HUAS 31 TaxID=3020055 RepID=UPI002305F3F7|nr:ATP-binding protein [Streptomyces sp. HUAS 31]WCD94199.1 ATP-binding protein [Streptomyces sp. HUAS 31]
MRPSPAAREVIVMYATVEDLVHPAQDTSQTRDRLETTVSSPGATADGEVTQELEHRPDAAGAARTITRAVLEDWHADQDAAESVLLVVSELVTNAVEHALPPVALHLYRDRGGDQVWVGVTDGGPAQDDGAWTSSCTQEEHGRGLAVVEVLATSHGTRNHPGGTATHWARLTVHEAEA